MQVPWTPLLRSRRERAVRRAAQALAAAAAAALLLAATSAQSADPVLLAAMALTIAAAIAAGRPRCARGFEIGVDARGRVVGRYAGESGTPDQALQCVYASPWLITLCSGTMCVPIWPDSVPGSTFRRLWVHVRWSSVRRPGDLLPGAAPGQPR